MLAVWFSFSVNSTIDALGHFSRGGIPTRSWFTHSVFTAPVWGCLVGWLTLDLVYALAAQRPEALTLGFWMTICAIIALGHLFLDSLTGAGVYFTRKRISLAQFGYDNILLNLGFIAAGTYLTILSFWI